MPPSRSLLFAAFFFLITFSHAQEGGGGLILGGGAEAPPPPPPGLDTCDGVYVSYTFNERTMEYPHLKNASAQAYAFKSSATVLNAMTTDLKAWKLFIGFQHREILVSVEGAVIVDGSDFPASVENGTTLMGYPQTDLPSSINTAGDLDQIQVKINFVGTQFGLKGNAIPMPKKLELLNDGFKCPKATGKGKYIANGQILCSCESLT